MYEFPTAAVGSAVGPHMTTRWTAQRADQCTGVASRYLMREVIRGHPRPSEALRDDERPSDELDEGGNQRQ
jgi:hypothetical protein